MKSKLGTLGLLNIMMALGEMGYSEPNGNCVVREQIPLSSPKYILLCLLLVGTLQHKTIQHE